ncbi:arylacetamide deacetylase-like [Pomacea canaliculata]|uniref:arylacetamide deacetylase-like n=1 Tax=Pomacea canaliculata TaxID=400727 RepID=UPI000D726A2A|nr:arylacetamide deacetylase-like [Pomacea canaliculata]XP_025095571.1 arylacetamide deacetylase-like [Pomacea canaliculata]XP_025095572.1 arylacetamide deacetylase-like [Pomacea canaliculata]
MGLFSGVSLIFAVCVAGLAFYLYTPLPSDIDQPGIARAMCAMNKMLGLVERMCFGLFCDYKNEFRRKQAVASMLLPVTKLDSDPDLKVTNEVYDGVKVRVYRPVRAPVPTPAVMYFHGGGWCWGAVDTEDSFARLLAKEAQLVVISVEYRLAPEYPFPAPLDDCVTATQHVLTHSLDLRIDPKRVGVAGLSAGGNLAAAVALRMQDFPFRSLPRLRFQVLLMPGLQGLDFDLPSYRDNDPATGHMLSRDVVAKYVLAYAGLEFTPSVVRQVALNQHVTSDTRAKLSKFLEQAVLETATVGSKGKRKKAGRSHGVNVTLAKLAEQVVTNPLFSPLLAEEQIRQLPPSAVIMSQYDVLRDEALLYVHSLQQAGVPVVSHLVNRGHHLAILGASDQDNSNGGRKAYLTVLQFIRKMVEDV